MHFAGLDCVKSLKKHANVRCSLYENFIRNIQYIRCIVYYVINQ